MNRASVGYRIHHSAGLFVALVLTLLGMMLRVSPAYAGTVSGTQTFFIPGDETQLYNIMDDLRPTSDPQLDPDDGMHATIGMTASANGTIIYYDHWEDGYDAIPATPGTSTEVFSMNRGDVQVLESYAIPVGNNRSNAVNECGTSSTPVSGNCYDGRDRIYVVGGPVTVSRAAWTDTVDGGEPIGTYFALSWELYATKALEEDFVVPIGEDLVSMSQDFDRVYVIVQATEDNTTVQIDNPDHAGIEVNTTLDMGETTELYNVDSGTTVTANNPVQVQIMAGEEDSDYAFRGFTGVPTSLWATEYYAPVGSPTAGTDYYPPVDIYLYNPGAGSITVNVEDSAGSDTITIDSEELVSYHDEVGRWIPIHSGVHLWSDDIFWGLGSYDADDQIYDWGYSLVPIQWLTNEHYVSWAPGNRPGSGDTGSHSPLFVTPVEDNTTIYIDYSPLSGVADETVTLDQLETTRFYDPDLDATGSHIWSTGDIAIVWGQEASNPGINSNWLDMGYTTLPVASQFVDEVVALDKSVAPDVISTGAGQVAEFTLVVTAFTQVLDSVVVTDTLPADWAYVDDSTSVMHSSGSQSSGNAVDPTISGGASQVLVWDNLDDLGVNEALTITFSAVTTDTPDDSYSINNAEARVEDPGDTPYYPNDSTPIYVTDLAMSKVSSAGGETVESGDTVDYTIVITNTGSATHSNIVVSDTVPAGTTYVAGSSLVTTSSSTGTFADTFESVAYDNSDGTLAWTTSWDEGNDDDDPDSGDIDIVTDGGSGRLHLQDDRRRVSRAIDLSSYSEATLTFDRRATSLESGDAFYLDIFDGTDWHNAVLTWDDSDNDTTYTQESVTFPSAYLDNATEIRFRSNRNVGNNDELYIDNVVITVQTGSTGSVAGEAPPVLIPAADGYNLAAGEVMTVTYSVTVDASLPQGLGWIDNTAAVSSDESPDPLTDSTRDPLPTTVIGNYVWLDENGDGVQDAGEDGIANVTVELYDSDGWLAAATTTDAHGGYLFSGVPAGNYTVSVDTTSLPSGLAANPTYDEDSGTSSPDAESGLSLRSGDEHLTADFGFNWAAPADTANPDPADTGAIGDRVWIDADGDGVQDPGETGLNGVTVSLLTDDNGDGIYGGTGDSAATTTTTDAAGNYIFDDLAPGGYVVQVTSPGGYTQTGDPDEVGMCAACDASTSSAAVLAPGDVYVNADFGYQPSGNSSTIGDTVFIDADLDGTQDTGEPGIAGVTVALLNASDQVIATTITDAGGTYAFPGLPAGTYTVKVTDTDNVLGELDPASDADGGSDEQSTTTIDGVTDDLDQDFGYAPPGHTATDGIIGDTIFLDTGDGAGGAADGDYDAGEGLEGITVELYDSTGTTLLATTSTNENGTYVFGGLDATQTYLVKVDTNTLPNGGTGLANSIDPNGGNDSESSTNLATTGGVDLDQDFGYTVATPNTIAGTIWEDSDANGALDEAGQGLDGITVVLLDAGGNVVATTVTDAGGDYSFTGLPDSTYTVDVTDEDNVLGGFWHSDGANDGVDLNSQDDGYQVTVTGGETNTTGDFGYYHLPAAIGNFIWDDVNRDGIQDPGEDGYAAITVTLTITYPNGAVITLNTVTDSNGAYSFGNLLLDEDYNGEGGGEPIFWLTIDPTQPALADYEPTDPDQGGDDDADSEDPLGAPASPVQGQTDSSYDFGFRPEDPTAVTLRSVSGHGSALWLTLIAAFGCVATLGAKSKRE